MNSGTVDLRLKKIIENIEGIDQEKRELTRQINDILKEAKVLGFDTKIIRKIVALRRIEPEKRIEMEQLLDTYKEALGM